MRSRSLVAASIGLVLAGILGAGLLGGDGAREAVLAAGLLVLAMQLPLHFVLRRWRERDDRFMAAIVIGFAARVGVLALGVVVFVIPDRLAAVPFLLALGAFMLLLLIAEAAVESRRVRDRAARGAEVAAS